MRAPEGSVVTRNSHRAEIEAWLAERGAPDALLLQRDDATRQALMMMFLSLPIYQDPAPWNIVWRAGELFPIDVGDGTTYEDKWDTFAQKYIGSLNECYRMSLKTLCAFSPFSESELLMQVSSCFTS